MPRDARVVIHAQIATLPFGCFKMALVYPKNSSLDASESAEV
jgi:hypothetical protein